MGLPVRVEVRLAAVELQTWRAGAARAGLSVSGFVRAGVNRSLGSVRCRLSVQVGDGGSWREVFLVGLEGGLSVTAACRRAGVSRALVYRERSRSREFAVAWELACEAAENELADTLLGPALLPRSVRLMSVRYRAGTRPERGGVHGRQARLQLRVEQAELQAWREAASAAGVSLSGLVRRLVRGAVANPAAWEARPGSWRPAFVAALRQSGHVADACRVAGVSRSLVYAERARSRAFAAAWEDAEQAASDRVSGWLWQLGVQGIPIEKRTLRHNRDGTQTTIVTRSHRRSDWALIELLRRCCPEFRF